MTAEPQEIRKGRKYDQVLHGAREVFLGEGFEGASVDDIARAAGVSKATLYSYFPDKRLLFLEVARSECRRHADSAMAEIRTSGPPAEVLGRTARRKIAFYTSDFGLRMFRVFVAESARFPDIGRAFYKSGPEMGRAHLMDYLRQAVERGELEIADLALAADQFHELCRADLFYRAIFNVTQEFTPEECDRVADGAVATFLARYGT
ncbi:TetR/AcrR family transcriptional regulator [Limimaricola hongkongensis]|uniref:Transcriptional regulator, TetR family n=1 Tax=Limimaricola hongkongensis DSM 17492 TaxID=1122180 RepID=A0A017HFI2_9RHOB|nr:TetR/AcrR family transcriptional regulator [Limimaricola hongkongensis]EYD73040.1 Transcriptional regulator, TetR family [Limimaricola hongkongensis DSM 17492]